MGTRYRFLDVYRGIIVLLMIEGHVVRELLSENLKDTGLFRLHELFHGIVGPGFLLGAGITFGITAQMRWGQYLIFSPAMKKRLGKILLLLGIAYALHLPFFSLSKTLSETTPGGWQSFFAFDVLQCIGFGLIILQGGVLLVRRERWFPPLLGILMVVSIYGAPIVWNASEQLPGIMVYALTGTRGSYYPLLPYAAFLFAGALLSYEFLRFRNQGREKQFIGRLAITGVALHLVGLAVDALPVQTYAPYDYWQVSPNFLLIKLGGICLLISGAWYMEQRIRTDARWMKWLTIVGVESLFVYVVHLLVLYGWVVNPSTALSSWWHGKMDGVSSAAAALVFCGLMVLAAWLWNMLKTRHPVLAKGINWWMGIVLVVEFVMRPY